MIEVTPLYRDDLPQLARIWSQTLLRYDFPCTLSAQDIEDHVLLHGGEPRAILAIDPKGWLVAREAGKMVGFAHCTVGRLAQDEPETMRGFLRALVVAEDAPPGTIGLLVRAANAYFLQKSHLTNIIAFHMETGYPRLLYGRGTVMGMEWAWMQALGEQGYQLAHRWLFYEHQVDRPMSEHLPNIPNLILDWETEMDGQITLMVRQGVDILAKAHFMLLPQNPDCPRPRAASLYQLNVEPTYQRQGIGRWMLERGANHLLALGIPLLTIHALHEDTLTQSRLLRLGFHESPLRGYTYERALS